MFTLFKWSQNTALSVLANYLHFSNCTTDSKDKIEAKFVDKMKLYFGVHSKRANTQVSTNIGKSAKNLAGIFWLFCVTTYWHVFLQQVFHQPQLSNLALLILLILPVAQGGNFKNAQLWNGCYTLIYISTLNLTYLAKIQLIWWHSHRESKLFKDLGNVVKLKLNSKESMFTITIQRLSTILFLWDSLSVKIQTKLNTTKLI